MNKKVINNAISAYFGLGLMLAFNKSSNENINNPFVKKHARTATVIHILMIMAYIVFISYGLFSGYSIYGFQFNHIIGATILILLLGLLLYGVLNANKGAEFSTKDMAEVTKTGNLAQIRTSNLNEKGVITILFSLVPFIGFLNRGKYYNYKSPMIENNLKLNFILAFIVALLFASGYGNLGMLAMLLYIVFLVFYSILLIGSGNILTIDLKKVPTLEQLYIYIIAFLKYSKNYFSSEKFIGFKEILKGVIIGFRDKNKSQALELGNRPDPKIPGYIAYIPAINIISLIDIKSKNRNHIINGLLITILGIVLYFTKQENYNIFLLFMIFYGIGFLHIKEYRMPVLFDIYELIESVLKKILSIFGIAKKAKKTKKEVSFETKFK